MALEPHEIDLDALPHSFGGGLKREPVEELLQRVQREYSLLYYEQKRLKEELELSRAEPKSVAPPTVFEAQSSSSETQAARQHPPEVDPVDPPLITTVDTGHTLRAASREPLEPASRTELDDVARLVLAWAHRTSTELRESARRDCELMLKKTRSRIAAADSELERSRTRRLAELEELDSMISGLRAQLQATLDMLVDEQATGEPANENLATSDPGQTASGLRTADTPAGDSEPPADGHTAADTPSSRLEAAS